jgi:cell division protein FtsL
LGKARAEQSRLRETKRVLELEVTSYQTPQRVEKVARTLLAMTPPSPERVIPVKLRSSPKTSSGKKSSRKAIAEVKP